MPFNIDMFKQLQRFLDANVDDIRISEGSLFSHKLKVAGSVDLVASYQGKKAIIDFKTSTKPKRLDWIENYLLQASMYSFMFWEMTKIYHPTIVIAIAVEEDDNAQIFVENASDWIDKARDRCARYHSFYGAL
jgi:genome maintenance exonuclease 1